MNRNTIRVALEEKKQQRLNMEADAGSFIKALEDLVEPLSITPLKDLKTDLIFAAARRLHDLRGDYVRLLAEIDDLQGRL